MREIAEECREVIKGWQLCITMLPRTPLTWLLRHFEFKDGADYPAEEVSPEHAIWVSVTKTWAEMGSPLEEPPPSTVASGVGQISEDGGDFLPFLIRYREIIESPVNRPPGLQPEQLKAEYPQYAHVIEPKPRRRKARSSPGSANLPGNMQKAPEGA
ncbi:hypothetical protein [Rhizobium sullae]|uniref:Uncharacterized protein n=1 Tax=Rhizobium sullae TaxID=50338 RepID=A0A4R3Q3Q2_RHISU|nr:hypothetical protein [Rhizobium sullae]TCU15780.1 hypothetical protein EV132_106122 [Rhizobium sullae]